MFRRTLSKMTLAALVALLAFGGWDLAVGSEGAAHAKGAASKATRSSDAGRSSETRRSPDTRPEARKAKSKKKKRRSRGKFTGRAVGRAELRQDPLPRPSGNIVVRAPALKEVVSVNIYNEDGSYNQEALAQLDRLWRCRKTHEVRAVDPRLLEVLSHLYDRYGVEIQLNSGFRFQRNEGSRHFHASAMDIVVPGVSYKDVYNFAQTLDTGGMGIGRYPRSGFVHIDFRAPGEPSYRWTDTHGSDGGRDPGKAPSRMWKRSSKPNT